MANFPAGIRCSGMSYVPGVFPVAAHVSTNGNLVQVRASNKESGARLRIRFTNITRSELASIRSHYQGEGTTASWLLSTVLLDGAEYASEISTMRWRYAQAPEVQDVTDDVHNVAFELEHAPVLGWSDTYTLTGNPATVIAGQSATLIGPDVPPTLWASRLTTAGASWATANTGTFGSMRFGADGVNFHAFWFPVVGETGVRVVVVKRLSNGTILWQRWTSAAFGNNVTTRDSLAPVVLAMSDGGCVVTAQENRSLGGSTGTPPTRTLRMWRIDGDGAELWKKEYVLNSSGAYNLELNDANIVVMLDTVSKLWVSPSVSFNDACPALLRIDASNGSYVNGQAYQPVASDGSSNDTTFFRARNIVVLPSGRLVFKSARDVVSSNLARVYLLEVSADLNTVHASGGYSNNLASGNSPYMPGPLVRLSDGGYLSRQEEGFIRFDSSYNILANYRHRVTIPSASSGTFDVSYFDGRRYTMKFDANGNGFAFGYNFSQNIRGTGFGIVELTSDGASVASVSEIVDGTGAGEIEGVHDIDTNLRYGVAALVGTSSASCYVTALGFNLIQPTSTAATSTAAGTLDTGSCGNTLTTRGWEGPSVSSGTITNPFTKYPITVQSGAITLTSESTGSLSMVDASGSLSWTLTRLLA